MEKGYIYKGYHEGYYCISDETFYPLSQLISIEGNIMQTKDGKAVEWTKEENYKLKLSTLKPKVLAWLLDVPIT